MNLWRVSQLARRRGGKNARSTVKTLLLDVDRKVRATLKNL